MRALFAKIREILRDRHLRRIWTRVISVMASVVVFISTYALILPAITMESEAACGIEAHQHTDECYEDVLTCGQEESEDHQHTDACYTRTLICEKEAHIHSAECYKEDSSAVAVSGGTAVPAVTDGSAGDSSSDQSSGNHQTGQTSQPTQVDVSDASGPAADAEGQGAGAEMSGTPENAGTTVTAEGLPADANTLSDGTGYVPVLDILNFDSLLTKETGFYYFHEEEGQPVPENSSAITDWKKLKNNITLASTDLVKAYLAYSIPAGALNETNQTARYRLPANLHLTDDQIQAINSTENGVAAAFAAAENGSGNDSGNGNSESAADGSENTDSGITGAGEADAASGYEKYLGAEAVEGTRTPDKTLREGAQEYISATVKAENVYEGMLDENGNYIDFAGTQASPASDRKDLGDYIGQDLIFTFTPYTVQKNQNTYDTEGNPLTAGEKVTGWFAVDFNMDQIDWVEEDTDLDKSTVEKSAEVIFALEDASIGSKERKTTLKLEEQAPAGENGTEDTADQDKDADENADLNKTDKDATDSKDAEENAEKAVDVEDAEKAADHTDGTLTADGDGYSITLAYTADAQIPENASLSVKEITPDTDPEAYEACLQQAAQKMGASIPESGNAGTNAEANAVSSGEAPNSAEAGAPALDTAASRFFDIEIVVTNEDGKTEKIEPKAPVAVNIQLSNAPEAAKKDKADNAVAKSAESGKSGEETSVDSAQKADPTVLHFAEEGVEEMDATVAAPVDGNTAKGKKDETGSGDTKQAENAAGTMEISFEAESFSIYGVVYTVDFSYEINGKVYGFTMQGADSVSLRALIDALHVYEPVEEMNTNSTDSDSRIEAEVSNADLPDQDAGGKTGLDSFMSDIKTVTFSNEQLLVPVKVEENTTVGKIKTDLNLFPTYPLGLTQSEVLELNAKEYTAGDWALISMKAFDTEESLTITMNTGESFAIIVTDAQDAVMVGDQVQTISNPAGTTIDLFDYWIVSQELAGRDGWDHLNQNWGGHPDTEGDNGFNLNGGGNNMGINSSTEDEKNGHALKFSPGWDGTVYNGTKEGTHRYFPNWESGDHNTYYDVTEPWRSLNEKGKDGLNSYTGNADPFQGIVQGTLVDGYPVLTNNDTIGSNGESLAYLFDTEMEHAGKASYPSVNQLLYVDKDGYYTYNSRDYRADYNNGTFILTEQTSDDSEVRGFWPFGTQNFWAGLHINTPFSMPVNGQVLNPKGEYKDMQFEFSGDDDTWLYVDGVLVGDGGGIHNRTEIDVNFANGTVTVSGKKGDNHSGDFEETKYLDDIFKAAGKYNDVDWEDLEDGSGHKRFKAGTDHTFDMFYLERGGGESNLYIHYNLISTSDFTAHKAYKSEKISGEDNPDDVLKRNQFQFELIGYDADDGTHAIMPAGDPAGDGTVESPKLTHNDEEGYSSLIIGVSEDGNINFGDVALTNQNLGQTFKYLIREIIPKDAEYVEGKGWVKDGVTYDDKAYFFTGEVQETETGFKLKKTRYTDETYTTVDSDTQFNSFENTFKAEPGKLELDKTDSFGNPVANAEFTLYTDPRCRNIAQDGNGNDLVKLSGTNGKVTFDNIPAPAVYYLKETQKPGDDYVQNDTIYEVHVFATSSGKTSVITVYGEENGEPLTTIVNSKKGELSVKKVWLDESGKPMTGSQDVNVTLKRRKTEVPADLPTNHITFQMHISDPGNWGSEYSNMTVVLEEDVIGYNAAIEWYDCWQDQYLTSLTVTQQDGTPISTDHYTYWSIDENDHSKKLLLYGISEGARVEVEYGSGVAWLWQGDNKTKVQSPSIEAGEVQTEIVEDDDFNYDAIVLSAPDYFRVWKTGGNPSNYVADGYDLPAVDANNRPYYYYVEELELEGYQTTYSNNEGITEGQIRITNQSIAENSINVVIKKTDNAENSTNYLDGAVFKLMYRSDSSGTFTNVSNESVPELDSNSQFIVPKTGITLTGLVDGQYRLQEISPPSGYVIVNSTPVTFTVSGGTITSREGSITDVRYTGATEDNYAEFIIPNPPGAALPSTGGPGTRLLTILGSILILGAGVLLWRRRRLI